jgi:hypothetical protein
VYCSECGQAACGKFCSSCGSPLSATAANAVVSADGEPDWEHEVRYEEILKFPGVRETIERHARQARKRMTGEQFLALADKVVPLGVSMEGLTAIAQPLYARLGIKTGKERTQQVRAPVGKVLVGVLCSLARNGQTLRAVTQGTDGCLLEAALPSDLFSLEGELLVGVHRDGTQAQVSAATHIRGQLYDWGKSNRCLETLFSDVVREAA